MRSLTASASGFIFSRRPNSTQKSVKNGPSRNRLLCGFGALGSPFFNTSRILTFFASSVINIFKSIVMDEDVLEKEDLHILDRIKDFASTVEKEIVPPIPAAKQLLVLVDRAVSAPAMDNVSSFRR